MSILAEIKRKSAAPVTDRLWSVANESLVKAEADLQAARDELTRVKQELAQASADRDWAQQGKQTAEARLSPMASENAGLKSKVESLEGSLKSANAQIKLEQDSAREAMSRIGSTVDSLRDELLREKETSANLRGQLSAPKPQPAPVIQSAPPPDLSNLEFEVGNIIRGANGIAGAKIKLVRKNS